ncbi:hypothetical protein BLA29_000124 [Euroglyphus maynei]|uniref:Enolase-phosphatase E1-like protein n=1 Tax=Euroglyphus maynei TaxID=6958 RepID=A0A1Y3BDC3_EURMA|nr:hypothetical protein BLA29_000124 [Euroglyphus maynei]
MVIVKVKQPKVILFDISGTVARESFVEKILEPYFKIAFQVYMENAWLKEEWQDCLRNLSIVAERDSKAPKIDLSKEKSDIIKEATKYIEYCLENNHEPRAFVMFRFLVWFDGYERNKIKTPVYSDVAVTMQRWKLNQNIRLYVLSNGWKEATRKFMSDTSHGDLNAIIEGHFDNSIGSLENPETYLKVAQSIQEKPGDQILFLTKSALEGKAAQRAALNVILVLTRTHTVDEAMEICQDIPIARSFTDIEFF